MKGITGTEIPTSGSRMLEFKLGRRFYSHRFVVPSVQMEYSGILAKIDLVGNYIIVGHDRFPFVTVRLQTHYSQSARKTTAVASNDRPGQSVRSERNSHIKLPAPTGPEFEDSTNPHLSAQDTQEGKSQLREVVREGGVRAILACCTTVPPRSMAIVKTNLVTGSRDKILKSEFPETVVLEPVEICMKGVYCGRALSDVNCSSEIGHSGMQGATRSGVLKLIDNGNNDSSDGGNPRIVLPIEEIPVDKVTSYSEVVRRNAPVERNISKQLKLEKCKVSLGDSVKQSECPKKSNELGRTADLRQAAVSSKQYASCLMPVVNTSGEEVRLPAGTSVAMVETQWQVNDLRETENVQKIQGLGLYPKQLDPKVKVQNRRVPKLLEDKLQHLSLKDREILKPVLLSYQDLFKKTEDGMIPCTSYGHHEIKTGNAAPVKKQQYRVPYALRDEMRRQIEEMKERGVISEASSEWAAPVILITKKSPDNTPRYRFCADFRGLNAVTQVPVYTMPLVQENLDILNGNKYFSVVDMKDAYYHIPIEPEHKHKTGIITPWGPFQYERLAFGLSGAPATFTKIMDQVLLGLGNTICLIFMDDLLIFSKTIEEQAERLKQVFERLRRANFTLNLAKCHFGEREVEYLGHTVREFGSSPSPNKTKAIKDFPRPRTVRDVRAFLGLSGYYRQYIPRYADIAQPLTLLTKKDQKFGWSENQEKAFQNLKDTISSDSVLAYPSMLPEHEFRLHTDASDIGISAVLAQDLGEGERPISFASRQLNAAEKKLSVTEKELLAVIFGTKQFRCYLYGRKFTLITDHRALGWLLKLKEPSAKLTKWALRLSEFQYRVQHRPGKQHVVPDALSRHIAVINTEVGSLDRSTVQLEQERDKYCQGIRSHLTVTQIHRGRRSVAVSQGIRGTA